ncbi:aspartyl protease family protein [Methylobacter tundripaludum]|uniref:aspartyl protease family protein n=1 Tax=Methylobacter tundripaludum TaxID=173365 RepID=UPI0004DF088A|nr:retroviral-like aspartic protease family protein [Methylobacter tundripaludum]
MTTVTYSNQRTFLGNRPYSNITLLGVGGCSDVNFSALVDTGADYLQLPQSAAIKAGINLDGAHPTPVHGATGTAFLLFVSAVRVEVEGKVVVVDAFFDPTNSSSALLGRQCLLTAVEAGFKASEWLWEY